MIRRNPGTTFFILAVILTFWLGVYAPQWPEPIARLAGQVWMLTIVWWMTTLNARWIDGRMKKRGKHD